MSEKLTKVEEALYQTKNKSNQDPLNYPIRLNNKLSNLTGVVSSADAAPTEQTYAVYKDIAGKIDMELAKLKTLLGDDLTAFNRLVKDKDVPAVVIKDKKARGLTVTAGAGQPTEDDDEESDEPHERDR